MNRQSPGTIAVPAVIGLLLLAPILPASATEPDSTEPAPTEPAPTEPTPSPDRIVVDGSEVGIMSPASLEEISQSATAEAAVHGIEPHQMRVTLVVLDHLEALRGVRVSIVTPALTLASDDGDPRGPVVAQCSQCAEAELKTSSIEGVIEAISRFEDHKAELEAREAAARAEEAKSEPPSLPGSDLSSEESTRPPRPPLRPLGWAGVATLSVGTAGLATGATFVGLGKRPLRLETGKDLLRNFATPGYALLGVGAVLAITGVIMLGVERRRARRSTNPALLVLPTPTGPAMAGCF